MFARARCLTERIGIQAERLERNSTTLLRLSSLVLSAGRETRLESRRHHRARAQSYISLQLVSVYLRYENESLLSSRRDCVPTNGELAAVEPDVAVSRPNVVGSAGQAKAGVAHF